MGGRDIDGDIDGDIDVDIDGDIDDDEFYVSETTAGQSSYDAEDDVAANDHLAEELQGLLQGLTELSVDGSVVHAATMAAGASLVGALATRHSTSLTAAGSVESTSPMRSGPSITHQNTEKK